MYNLMFATRESVLKFFHDRSPMIPLIDPFIKNYRIICIRIFFLFSHSALVIVM